MRSTSLVAAAVFGLVLSVVGAGACGSSSGAPSGASASRSSGTSGSGSGSFGASSSGSGAGSSSGGETACPTGLQCNVSCTGGGTTTITGTVYDPAGNNPLYDIAVYVPAVPLVALPKGVPVGADACNCGALFPSGAVTNTTTAVDGTFTLKNVPVGSGVPLVLQIGKWRRQFAIDVKACTDNAAPDKTLRLPSTVPAGDITTNMPDIAVSTGSADSLECLMRRIGLPNTEYVAGAATGGHIHVFAGGDPQGNGSNGTPEFPGMLKAPASPAALWDKASDLMPYDIVLLSCEGGETFGANPSALESYLNAGGRAFGSHFHYAWFSGPIATKGTQSYAPPSDWSNLATWATDPDAGDTEGPIGGILQTTLNGSANPFSKGLFLQEWLQDVGALGTDGQPPGELSIWQPRFNATISAANTPSQPWIAADPSSGFSGATMYFSFDTPVNAPLDDAGVPAYCGRAVFSDLHVSGNPSTEDLPSPVPLGCATGELPPQEKALEFMLFDLSSCVLPDTVTVQLDAGLPPPPR